MSRALLILDSPVARQRAASWCLRLPSGTRAEFKESKRTLPQNSRLWAMLTDVATQVPWHGLSLRPDDYKLIFLDALKREVRAVPNLDGTGFVNIGRSSSDLSKSEMGDLMELIAAFGAERGVVFHDERVAA
jgi:ferric-dicitrate binding protein FerR (iron transport regulator)